MRTSPFDRPLDRHLEALRHCCGPDPYRLVPGEGDEPDAWKAKCPAHPDAGYTLVIVDQGEDQEPLMSCTVGCPTETLRWAMGLRPEIDAQAEAVGRVLAWKTRFSSRRKQSLERRAAA